MIPSDLAARLRMLTEASFFEADQPVGGLARMREIQGRLPELLPGERFHATLQRPLPDGTFQAIVAGKQYTLALDRPAKAGDTLELVVVRHAPNAVVAQLAATAGSAATSPSTNLSATGRLIGYLLTGQPAAQPAQLAVGTPLLDAPPASGAHLASALRQALARSGLFYESHQLQWLSGKIDAAALRLEPQGRGPLPAGSENAASAASGPGTSGSPPAPSARAMMLAESAEDQPQAPQTGARAATGIPDRLLPIVHQQLDSLATQHYVWHGQVWPGQTVEWEIDDPARDARDGDDAAADWNTTLRLTLPRLGAIEARLALSPAGLALRLVADEPATAAALDAARARLDGALAAADLTLAGFVAERRDGER